MRFEKGNVYKGKTFGYLYRCIDAGVTRAVIERIDIGKRYNTSQFNANNYSLVISKPKPNSKKVLRWK